jgi:predicted PurR-regulated permease PerM
VPDRQPVPWRTIVATVAVVAGAYLLFLLVRETARILVWILVAGFFAIILAPAVDALERRLHLRRGLAAAIVFLIGVSLIIGMLYAFIRPVVDQVDQFIDQLPEYVDDAQEGRGWVGELVDRYDLEETLRENQNRLQDAVSGAGKPALAVVQSVFSTVAALLSILVLAFLMILRGPELTAGALALVSERYRERVRAVAADAAKAVSGYMLGNLLISLIAGVATYVMLKITRVPYAEVIALFVAFCDLIPLVGATLGAIPTIGLAFLHSTTAGIVALVFYVVYQQFENHVLQVSVMSKTVDVNPLTVLVSVLIGVELFGFLGALLAIPVAGILQVVVRNLYDERSGGLKTQPTVGAEERPVSEAEGP